MNLQNLHPNLAVPLTGCNLLRLLQESYRTSLRLPNTDAGHRKTDLSIQLPLLLDHYAEIQSDLGLTPAQDALIYGIIMNMA